MVWGTNFPRLAPAGYRRSGRGRLRYRSRHCVDTFLRNTGLMFSTRVKQSTMGFAHPKLLLPKQVPRLQLPTSTVAVPWRTTSGRPAPGPLPGLVGGYPAAPASATGPLGLDDAHGLGRGSACPRAATRPSLSAISCWRGGPPATVENQCIANQGYPRRGCHCCNPQRYPGGSVTARVAEPVVYPPSGIRPLSEPKIRRIQTSRGPACAVTRKHQQICLCWQ